MPPQDEQRRGSPYNLAGEPESPFLSEEFFVKEVEPEWEVRVASLEAESPYQNAFDEGLQSLSEPEELNEEFVEEERSDADVYISERGDLSERQMSADLEFWNRDATLEFEAAGCTGDRELPVYEGELLDSKIWQGTADQIAFRDRVLNAHIALTRKHVGAAKRDLSPKELAVVAGTKISMGSEAAAAAGRLLAAANADLAKAQAAGHADALRTIRLSATSGYRSSTVQKKLWLGYFTAKDGYYDLTQAARERLADGPHSEQAVNYMLNPKGKGGFGLGGRIAAPGYSNHQGGIAIDFWQERKKGYAIRNNSGDEARDKWRRTWFHEWLRDEVRDKKNDKVIISGFGNAKKFGFRPIRTEEWHWEYHGRSGTSESVPAESSTDSSIITPTAPPAPSTDRPAAELVRFAQRVLNAAEGERLKDDGDLGQLTRAALERFRKKYRLSVGGMLDASIELALAQRALEELAQASMFAKLGTLDARTEQALVTFKSTRQLGMDAKLDAATRLALTDALAYMAPKPARTSTYLDGKLWTFESKILPMRVAVFCPRAAHSKQEVEVLVYAHGLLNGCPRPKSIPEGIITDAPFKLGEIVAASGRPIVLVVPYLDWANPGGESVFGRARRNWHALGKPSYLNSLVAETLAELGRVQSIATPSLNNLVIAGHSRAYDLLEPLAHSHFDVQMQQGALARLSQVWALDSTYAGDVGKWRSWLDAKPGLRIYVFYRPGSKTAGIGDKFYNQRSERLNVIRVKEGHCAVPSRRLPALLKPPVSSMDQESEALEDERDRYEADPEAEGFDQEAHSDDAGAEFYDELHEASEPAEEYYEEDRFEPMDELGLGYQHLSGEPELDALAFEALGSDEEEAFDEGEEFEDEDRADQILEEGAYGLERDTFIEPEAPPTDGVVFPSGQSLRVVAGYPEGKDEEFWDPTGSGNPLLDTGPEYKEKKLSTSFTVRELTTSGGVSAHVSRIDPKLVESLQQLRDHLGRSVTITSGYRSWKRNKGVYAKRNKKPTLSQHCAGRGADIKIKGMNGLEIGKAAIDACGPNIGVGLGNTFAHIDVRGYAVVWNYGGVQPGWIKEIKNYQQAKGGKRQPSAGAFKPPNDLVRFAQRVLNTVEGERLSEDGDLGRLTRAALERFRRKFNLGAGGVLDGKTQIALAQRALEEIRQQSLFGQLGVLDAATRKELIAFKSRQGLGANDTLDAATRAAIADALAQRVNVPSAPRPIAVPSGLPRLGEGLTPPADPKAYRKFRLTTYHVVDQHELPMGAVHVPIRDGNGRKIAEGSPAFFAQLSLEGTARLTDGRLINVTGKMVPVSHDEYAEVLAFHRQAYAKRDKKRREEGRTPTPTTYSGIVVQDNQVVRAFAFHEVPASRLGIGYGLLRGIPLVPFRTLAADIGVKDKHDKSWKGKGGLVPPGTHVFIKEYDGLQLPDKTIHDGWFIVNDTGGAIFGAHFDVFAGTSTFRKQVKLPEFGQVWFAGIERRIPPDYEYGLRA